MSSADHHVAGDAFNPDMVTATRTWLATDSGGNTIRVTSTYINDRAEIDYEPSQLRTVISIPTEEAQPSVINTPGEVSLLSVQTTPSASLPEETPGQNSLTTNQHTVVATDPISAPAASPVAPWDSYGVPFVLLNMLRGKHNDRPKRPRTRPKNHDKIGQNGRVEEGPIGGGVIEDAYDREQLFELYKDLVKDYGSTLMFPHVNEQELMFPLANGEVVTGTLQTSAGTSLVVGSATVGVGGPAATVKGQVVSLASQGIVIGSKTIPIQAVAPVNPTDYVAAVTLDTSSAPITLRKPADNPGIMTIGSVTLSAGGAPLETAGHSIFYNDHGEVVVDGTATIDPSPVRRVGGKVTPLGMSSGPIGGSNGGTGGSDGSGNAGNAPDSPSPSASKKQNNNAITMNGLIVDGGAQKKGQEVTSADSTATSAKSFVTLTTNGVVITMPAMPHSKASGTGKRVAGGANSVLDGHGLWKACMVPVCAFFMGTLLL